MGDPVTTTLLVIGVGSTLYSIDQQREAQEAAEDREEAEQQRASVRTARERTRALRQARIQRARALAQAQVGGAEGQGSSGLTATQANITGNTNRNLGFLNVEQQFGSQISDLNIDISRAQGNAALGETIGGLAFRGADLFQPTGGTTGT